MAILSTNATARETLTATFSTLVERFVQRAQQRRVYRTTVNELSALTDRDLDDLGINRGDITRVARDAANMV